MSLHVHLCAWTWVVLISCVLLQPVILIDEWLSLAVISACSQLLFSYLLALSIRDLCDLLSCRCHVFFISIHSYSCFYKTSFVFCQVVILNKNIGLNWPARLSDKWIIDSKDPLNLFEDHDSSFAPFYTHGINHSADQQIRGGMLNLRGPL